MNLKTDLSADDVAHLKEFLAKQVIPMCSSPLSRTSRVTKIMRYIPATAKFEVRLRDKLEAVPQGMAENFPTLEEAVAAYNSI